MLDLQERLDYSHLLEPDAKVVVVCNGSELTETLKVATCLGINQPKVYLPSENKRDSFLTELSGSTLLLTNTDLSKSKFNNSDSVAQNLKTVAVFKNGLNLFAEDEEEGWVNVLGFEDSLSG